MNVQVYQRTLMIKTKPLNLRRTAWLPCPVSTNHVWHQLFRHVITLRIRKSNLKTSNLILIIVYLPFQVLQYTLNSNDNVSQSSTRAPSSIKLPSVKPLIKLSNPLGIRASRYHAVVWNTRAVYTWGNNIGQLGHSNEDKIVSPPKRVSLIVRTKDI